jgi:DNA repair exonuclease SbcCD ATPase subunit
LDRTVSVVFHDEKYLIKAPIGSGKSFLFFDGPVFGYKYADRQMLSIKATEWYIKICCEHNGQILVVIRDITRTKSWNDTVKSSLYVIDDDIDNVEQKLQHHNVLERDKDIVWDMLKNTMSKKIECKNETDIQTTLATFLPPQEVFLATSMLLQNSENVFELAPAERIALFKEIFGLMSIDSATDKINDERKAVSALLKAKKITDDVDGRLQNNLRAMVSYATTLWEKKSLFTNLVDEIDLIWDKVTITWFVLDEQWELLVKQLQNTLNAESNTIQQHLGALDAKHTTLQWVQRELGAIENDIATLKKNIDSLEQKLHSDNTIDIQSLKNARQQRYDQRLQSLPSRWFSEEVTQFSHVLDIHQAHISQWVLLNEQISATEKTITLLAGKIEEDKHVLASYTEQLTSLQKDYDSKRKFDCIKIWAECPFVEQINTWLFAGLKKNIQATELTRNTYLEKITTTNTPALLSAEQAKLQSFEHEKETLKSSIYILDHKVILDAKKQYETLMQEQQTLASQEKIHAHALLAREEDKKTLLRYSEQIKILEKTRISLWEKLLEAQKHISDDEIRTLREKSEKNNQLLQTLSKLQQHIDRIHDLIAQFKDTQRAIKSLEEKETLLNDLYRIFSKEIMIKVLEDALPFFAEYVNNLLAKMVPFTIHFQPKKTASDKLELEITIRDHHGERQVKSLSGWQKAILRLAWILGVAQMTRTKQLFLDETINNIDHDTISQVADMLKDYSKTNAIAIYLVTHSNQLQMMNIRDKTIQLTTENNI